MEEVDDNRHQLRSVGIACDRRPHGFHQTRIRSRSVGFVQNMNLKQLFVTTSITETGDPLQKGIGIKHQTNGRTFGFHNDSL